MSSKSKAREPKVPLSSRRMAFFRPRANRVASKMPIGPEAGPSSGVPAKRAVKRAASSTVTGPRSAPAAPCPPRPTRSPARGRSVTKVSISAETPVMFRPVIHWAASMLCAPMSPSAPEPDLVLSSRQVRGASASLSQSCRYWARTCRICPSRPCGDHPLGERQGRGAAVAEPAHGVHAAARRGVRGRGHPLGLGHGVRERFLAQHVLAGLERRDGDLGVRVAGSADVDQVDVVPLDQRPPVRLHGVPAVLGRRGPHALRIPAGNGRQLGSAAGGRRTAARSARRGSARRP